MGSNDHERAVDARPDAPLLHVVHELPHHEVARTLAIRPAGARPRVSRALRHLSLAFLDAKESS